jgi:hypothetical protein
MQAWGLFHVFTEIGKSCRFSYQCRMTEADAKRTAASLRKQCSAPGYTVEARPLPTKH